MTSTDILITIAFGIVALCVTLIPISVMIRYEHRDLHGSHRSWIRRHGRRPRSVLDIPQMFNETSEERHQDLV